MEFWGIEVKTGESLKVDPGVDKILHLSQASLGEVKKEKGNESATISLKIDGKKLVLGTLSSENYPQLSFDLVFEKEFELSHNWKSGSVYFCGYKSVNAGEDYFSSEFSDSEDEELPLITKQNGKLEKKTQEAKLAITKTNVVKAESDVKQKVKLVAPKKENKPVEDDESDDDDELDDDEDDSEEDESDDEDMVDGDDDSEDEESSDDEDEDTPKKPESGKKRPAADSATKTPAPGKKAKLTSPQKTDGKKSGGHVATPHPAKQAGKSPGSDKKQHTPKSGGGNQVSCESCNRKFNNEVGLQAHNKAKHGAK